MAVEKRQVEMVQAVYHQLLTGLNVTPHNSIPSFLKSPKAIAFFNQLTSYLQKHLNVILD